MLETIRLIIKHRNVKIGRLWLTLCDNGETRAGGKVHRYVDGERKVSMRWTKFRHLQIMWHTIENDARASKPWIYALINQGYSSATLD
jgi:hypothetical protein